jgi:Niemann-Pick C1 protein
MKFDRETALNVILALVSVFFVVIIFTASMSITLFVLLCVILVDLFLFGILFFWDITLNSVTVINIVIAIGLAVDYSAHIGHAFVKITPPEKNEDGQPTTNFEKRVFKARGALGEMGSSVFHGAASTFLAIVTLSPSKSYVFMMFFKMWFGIIIFGVANGFILLPVLLSLCGPLTEKRN